MQTKFGYNAEQLGVALSLKIWSVCFYTSGLYFVWMTILMLLELKVDELEDAKEAPEEKALNFVYAMLENP